MLGIKLSAKELNLSFSPDHAYGYDALSMAESDKHASELRCSSSDDAALAAELLDSVDHAEGREWVDEARGASFK